MAFRPESGQFLGDTVKEITCNFAVARFRPYRDTGEFVNVGVVLLCPQLGYFDFCLEKRRHKRVTDFFPELELDVFKSGLLGMQKELSRVASNNFKATKQYVLEVDAGGSIGAFKELVRSREAIFHFSEVGTAFAQDPKVKLDELFEFYVKRQFAQDREYQEIIMRRKLADFLQQSDLSRYYKQDQRVGDEDYHVILPFVHFDGSLARKAIKPLHLDKESPTEIYRHGDAWISSVRRLLQAKRFPGELLFTVKSPVKNAKCQSAATDICKELERLDAITIPFADTKSILNFARV